MSRFNSYNRVYNFNPTIALIGKLELCALKMILYLLFFPSFSSLISTTPSLLHTTFAVDDDDDVSDPFILIWVTL